MKKQIVIVTVLLAISTMAISQDPFFSQFRVSPMTLNPALMGSNMNKSTRISMISRNQWLGGSSQPYITSTIGYEQKLGEKQLGEDQLVLGLMMLNEKSNGGILTNSFFSAGLNYQNSLDAEGKNKLSGALSVTYSNRMLDLNNATFQSQFGSFGFMNSAAAYDPIGAVNNRYFDMNLGVAYEHVGEKVDFEMCHLVLKDIYENTRNNKLSDIQYRNVMTVYKIIFENNNVEFVGKTNHNSLVFKKGNKQIKITNKGQII